MDYTKAIKNTEEFIRSRLENEGTGHDWWHAVRVSSMAKHLHEHEGGNDLVIDLASLLHDVGDRKVIGKPNDDYSIVKNFLTQQKVDPAIIDQVLFVIQNMSFSKNLQNKLTNSPIELMIVQDADRLDAMGAIGIARMFTYGGSNGQVIFNPEIQPRHQLDTLRYKQTTGSSFQHFDEKLLHLKDLLNTQTAKKIALSRDAFMRKYAQQFKDEWNGLQ
jgi:uncharacterized protein